jgi:hypothetical protein
VSKIKGKADEGEQARLAVNLPVSLHRLVKARAAEQGKSIRDYVIALLEKDGI